MVVVVVVVVQFGVSALLLCPTDIHYPFQATDAIIEKRLAHSGRRHWIRHGFRLWPGDPHVLADGHGATAPGSPRESTAGGHRRYWKTQPGPAHRAAPANQRRDSGADNRARCRAEGVDWCYWTR